MVRVNGKMETLLRSIRTLPGTLPAKLAKIGNGRLMFADGCIFAQVLYQHRGNATLEAFPDETGYECFVNHIHLDDYADDIVEQLRLALTLMRRIKINWRGSKYSKLPAEFIVSANETCCVLRFHVLRAGQNYLDADLDKYKSDAVLVSSLSEDVNPAGE